MVIQSWKVHRGKYFPKKFNFQRKERISKERKFFPKNFQRKKEIQSWKVPIVESTYLNRDMCKFESSQKDESRWQSTDSSKAYRNISAFKWISTLLHHAQLFSATKWTWNKYILSWRVSVHMLLLRCVAQNNGQLKCSQSLSEQFLCH